MLCPMFLGTFLVGFGPILAVAPSAHADSTVTVMTRNVYLGADVSKVCMHVRSREMRCSVGSVGADDEPAMAHELRAEVLAYR